MPGDGDQPPRPGPRKRPPGRPAAEPQQRSGAPARPGAPTSRSTSGGPTGARAPSKKAPAKKAPAKKAPAKKAPAKRPPAKQAPAKKAPAKKAPAKRPPAKQAPAKKAPAKRPPAKQAPAKKAPATKAPAKRPPAKRPPAGRAPQRGSMPPRGPVPHDRPAEEEREEPGAGDATAAVDAVDLLDGPSSQIVVRGEPRRRRPTPDPGVGVVPAPSPDLEPAGWGPDLPDHDEREPAVASGPGVHETQDGKAVRVTRSGKVKKLRGKHKRLYKAKKKPPSRLLNHYDVNGPRIRLGFLWFLLVALGIAAETGTDLPFIALIYGGAAGFAGWQAAREWHKRTPDGAPVQWAAAAIGLVVGLAGAASPGVVGLAVLGALPIAAVAAFLDQEARDALAGNVALTVQCGAVPGVAAASIALTWRVEPGAAIALFLLVSAYEVGDYVVGSGSLNAFEGPIAGVLAIAAIMLPLYAVQLPPINPGTAITYGLIVAIGAPLGQIAGSAVLPWSDAPAPALRRLDSLIVTGPVWLAATYLQYGVL